MKIISVSGICVLMFAVMVAVACSAQASSTNFASTNEKLEEVGWQEEFNLSERNLEPTGRNPYFILEPGYQLVLEGRNEKVTITVLDKTVEIAGINARVVEEKEWKNGQLVEVSRNYFVIDNDSADVFYFGEDVDDYKDGKIVNHGGAWRAGKNQAKPGMIMPGQPFIGQKHYQEIAPGVAMDRAEIVSLSETQETPAGVFVDSLKTRETTPLNTWEVSLKTYAPDIGMIQDEFLLLTEYGFVKE